MHRERPGAEANLQPSDLRRFLGCGGVVVGVLVAGIALLFWVGGQVEQEWAGARPADLTELAWQAQRGTCEEAKLGPAECATTPLAKIETAAAKQREKERLELCSEDAGYDAMENAKRAVSGRLRAPSTAEWSDVRATQSGCDWQVTGTVDAQNAFGGMTRSNFDVTLRRASKQTWLPVKVDIAP